MLPVALALKAKWAWALTSCIKVAWYLIQISQGHFSYYITQMGDTIEIECARRHLKAISDNGYIFDVAKDYKSLYNIVTK